MGLFDNRLSNQGHFYVHLFEMGCFPKTKLVTNFEKSMTNSLYGS